MNVPTLISHRVIDQDALEQQIAKQQLDSNDRNIAVRSRTQTMLSDLIEREQVLSGEHKVVRADRMRLQQNIANLSMIDKEMGVTENDIQVELQAVAQMIAMLKSAGVTE